MPSEGRLVEGATSSIEGREEEADDAVACAAMSAM